MININGKWALVTGASRGIGKYTSLALAREGCNLILHSRRKENLAALCDETEKLGVKVMLLEQDFFRMGAADELLKKIEDMGISVDILINNAGVNLSIDREQKGICLDFDKWTQEEYELTMRVNVVVPSLLATRLAARMRENGFGRVVTMTSSIHGSSGHLAYSVTKGAVNKLTGDLAEEMEGSGVAVSAVDPGWCQTYLGGEGAVCRPEDTCPGMLVPVCMESGSNGRIFHAQDYAGMTLEEAIAHVGSANTELLMKG